MNSLVSCKWLFENINNSNIIVLDASFKGVNNDTSIPENVQIKNARFFDLELFKNRESSFPNTYPNPIDFEKEIQKLGIQNKHHIIIYDKNGIYSAPRAWWLFKLMGHKKVSVLNGGLPNWLDKKLPVESNNNQKQFPVSNYKVTFQPNLVVDFSFIKNNISIKTHILVDARSEGRFNGTAKEPRKELASGSIPNSLNIPYQNVLKNGFIQSKSTLKSIFKELIHKNKPIVFSCGSGITACILLLASEQILNNTNKAIYDGSWTEWATLNKNFSVGNFQ